MTATKWIKNLHVSSRFFLVLAIGVVVQGGISIALLINVRNDLIENRVSEVKNLDETAYSAALFYYERSRRGLMSESDAQTAAKDIIRSLRFDKSNYYFVWDLDGNGVAHGSLPALEGKNLINSPEAKRLPFVSDMVRKLVAVGRSPSHEGVAVYRMTKLGDTEPRAKIAYAKLFKPWGWVVGTGAYIEDIDAAFWAQARWDLLFAAALAVLAGLACFGLGRDLSGALRRVSTRIAGVAAGELVGDVPDVDRGDEVGGMARALLVLRDTSSEVLSLKAEQAALEASSQAKTDFLTTMSHEIRTPLNGVIGTIGLLAHSHLDEQQRRLINISHDSANMLLSIVNDVLDYSKLESGNVILEQVHFSPDDLLDEVLSFFQDKAADKGLTLTPQIAQDAPKWVSGDLNRLRQILVNLVGNAIKFTDQGHVDVICYAEAPQGNDLTLKFEVRDTGIGISDEACKRLFTRFSQADSSITREFGGTGLGLAICKRLAELMGGEIGVRSQPGAGSVFFFSILCAAGEAPIAIDTPCRDAPMVGLLSGLHVLAADDNESNRLIIKLIVENFGCAVDVVCNGAEAVAAVSDGGYDLVLMDVQMPIMDGKTATQRIRALNRPGRQIPIIALTANALPGQREEYLAAGMDDYVTKPIQPTMLLKTMVAAMSQPASVSDTSFGLAV
jgi:signal transduction histidine kinase